MASGRPPRTSVLGIPIAARFMFGYYHADYVSCMLLCHPSGSSYAADADECSKDVQLVLHVQVYITSCLLACSQLPVEVYNISQKVCTHSLPSSHGLYCACAILSCAKHVAQYVAPGGMFPTSCSPVNCNMYTHISHSGRVTLM